MIALTVILILAMVFLPAAFVVTWRPYYDDYDDYGPRAEELPAHSNQMSKIIDGK